MTLELFEKKVLQKNWYDKYFYYYLAATCGGIYFLYDVIIHQAKYDNYGTRYLGYLASALLIFLGIRGFFLVPNRYKTVSINSQLPIEKKKEIINDLLRKFDDPVYIEENGLYSFSYKKKLMGLCL
jgi:hypothetical protein